MIGECYSTEKHIKADSRCQIPLQGDLSDCTHMLAQDTPALTLETRERDILRDVFPLFFRALLHIVVRKNTTTYAFVAIDLSQTLS